MPDSGVLSGRGLVLRLIGAGDLDAILAVLQDPSVARWWGEYDREDVVDEFADPEDAVVFAIEVDGDFAGFIQYGEETDPDYRHAAIDLALTAEFQGRGIGPEAIRTLARYLFDQLGHHRLTIDPAVANTNAISAYEKIGFQRVGVMRQYERASDGSLRDGLLMDLLASELSAGE
jgi:aminoglycoside 6'-N-acetyltransferase